MIIKYCNRVVGLIYPEFDLHIMPQKNRESDPDFLAMTLYMTVILHESIELAGAVRDLVHGMITQDTRIISMVTDMFESAADASATHESYDTDEDFTESMNKVLDMKDPAVVAISEIVSEQVSDWMVKLPYFGINQLTVESFVSSSPEKATLLATRFVDPDYLKELYDTYMLHVGKGFKNWPVKGSALAAFEKASEKMGSRAVRMAIADCGNAFAVAAAAHAVLVEQIPSKPKKFLENQAPEICNDLYMTISKMGVSQEWASELTKEILDGACTYKYDAAESCGELAVRALRAANNRAADTAARAAFCISYSIAIGAAWAAASDKDHFVLLHDRALYAAAGVDHAVCYAFDKYEKFTRSRLLHDPFDPWNVFLTESKLTIPQWAQIAQTVDYRAMATAAENATLVELYVTEYGGGVKPNTGKFNFFSDKLKYVHHDSD